MELSIGEMIMIALAIVVLFGPDKIPEIARGLGQGVRKMKDAVEDVKSEIMKEADNPVSEIKKEIDKVKKAAQDYNPIEQIKSEMDLNPYAKNTTMEHKTVIEEKQNLLRDEHEGPVSR